MSIKTPRLTRDRCGVYYFRLVVPLALRKDVGKTEYRRSLRTKDASIARQRALALCVAVEGFMAGPKISDFSHLFDDDSRVGKLMTIDFERGVFHADTPEEGRTMAEIVATIAASRRAGLNQVAAVLPSSQSRTNLETAKEMYLKERTATLKPATMNKQRGVLKSFIEFTGNVDVAMVTAQVVNDYKQKKLEDGLEATTINDQMSILKGLFAYCISNKIVRMENPAEGVNIVGAQNQAESYSIFTQAELEKIFEPVFYRKHMDTPDFYWGPLVALFTGARAEEIASLDLKQIRVEKNVAIMDILDGKTVNAVRKVPLHNSLLELGFLDYVQSMREAGYTKLFPHLIDGKNGYKKNMCRMFGAYLDKPEVNIVDPLKVFHSLRHTVVTKLTDALVNDGLKRALVGHDVDTKMSAHDDYIDITALTIPNLQLAINRINYEGLDLAGLKREPGDFLVIVAKRISQREKRSSRELAGGTSGSEKAT